MYRAYNLYCVYLGLSLLDEFQRSLYVHCTANDKSNLSKYTARSYPFHEYVLSKMSTSSLDVEIWKYRTGVCFLEGFAWIQFLNRLEKGQAEMKKWTKIVEKGESLPLLLFDFGALCFIMETYKLTNYRMVSFETFQSNLMQLR